MPKTREQSLAIKKAQAYRTNDPERIAQASRELAEANIAAAVERNLAVAPPLSPAQIKRPTGLLRTGRSQS